MTTDAAPPPDSVESLDQADFGVWAVRSASATVYYVNLDRRLLLRVPGPGSATGPYDGVWVRLQSVKRVRVGDRPEWLTDPAGYIAPYRYWIQREVTSIERVPELEIPEGRPHPGAAELYGPVTLATGETTSIDDADQQADAAAEQRIDRCVAADRRTEAQIISQLLSDLGLGEQPPGAPDA